MKQLSVILFLLLAAACGTASTSDPAADRDAIAAASAKFAAAENAGSAEQARVHFADDLVVMGPNSIVTGADSVAAAMRAFYDAFTVQVEYSSQEVVASGDWGFDRGTLSYTLTPKRGGAPIRANGKYLWIYRRQSDGSWKQSRVIWNEGSLANGERREDR